MQAYRFPFRAMACDNVIECFAPSRAQADATVQAAIDEVLRIEEKYSRYRADSVVSTINASAGVAPVEIDDETAHLLDYASICFEQSAGLFDITSGVLRRAWNFKADRPPNRGEIEPLLPLIGWPMVRREAHQVFLPEPGMEIDFGGFGKEYAVDRAAAVLLSFGLRHAFVSLGGDVTVTGPRDDGQPWQLGIRHPRDQNRVIARLPIASGAIATSGDYERYLDYRGTRYTHILDPKSGESVQGFQSVTVLAPTCLVAGSVSTIAMLKGNALAGEWLNDSGAGYLAVDANGQVLTNLPSD
jgi:thiamine biosynthesis lipoprotein